MNASDGTNAAISQIYVFASVLCPLAVALIPPAAHARLGVLQGKTARHELEPTDHLVERAKVTKARLDQAEEDVTIIRI